MAARRCSGRDCSENRKISRSSACFGGAGKTGCCSASSSLSLDSLSLQRPGSWSLLPALEAVEARRDRVCKAGSGLAAMGGASTARRRYAGAIDSAGFLGAGCGSRCFALEGLLSSERKSPANGLLRAGAGVASCVICDRVRWEFDVKEADWWSAGSSASKERLLRMTTSGARGAGRAVMVAAGERVADCTVCDRVR